MNYEQVQLLIDVSTNPDVEQWEVFDGSFTIDKTNPNISIKICNTLTNKKYFNDKSNAINVFKYNPARSFIKNIISWIKNK